MKNFLTIEFWSNFRNSRFLRSNKHFRTKWDTFLAHLPELVLPGMLLSVGKMSAHFSRSTWPARHSSVMIWRARWHRLTPSSVRALMSFLLIHCILEEPRARGFIRTPRALLTARRKGNARRIHVRLIHWHLQLAALADALERVDAACFVTSQ